MSTAVMAEPIAGAPPRPIPTIEPAQRTAARVAGLLYLLTNATAIFAFYVRGQMIVRGDAMQTARNITASERLFRVGIAAELITIAAVIMLVAALYVVLEPVNRHAALLATFWRLAENFVLAVVVLAELAALRLLSGADYMQALDAKQLQALAYTSLRVYGDGFRMGFVFLGLGSAVFAYLWLKSRYIPRWLAVVGIFGSLVMAITELTIMVFPGFAAVVSMAYMAPMGVFEIGLGIWLLVKGIRASSGG